MRRGQFAHFHANLLPAMKLWALSDPHLSTMQDKPMHMFGDHWRNHPAKIEAGWRARVGPPDVVLVTGDISWGHRLGEALPDLEWLNHLPGRHKLMVRGNHDTWWPATAEERERIPRSLLLLEGTAVRLGEHVFCGTGGWVSPEDPYFESLDHRAYQRELAALERALDAGMALDPEHGLHVLLHFPPCTSQGRPTAFDALLRRYPVRTVTFGHFHYPEEWAVTPNGPCDGIHYTLAAADFIGFTPVAVPLGGEAAAPRRAAQ